MGEPSDGMRIGDAERESALTALGEHLGAGRLDVAEYGERSARIAVARTRGDLRAVFTDLPAPRPTFEQPPVPALRDGVSRQRLVAALVPVSAVLAVVLLLVFRTWYVLLLPAVLAIVAAALVEDRPRDEGS